MRRLVWSMVVCALILPGAGCLCCALEVGKRAPAIESSGADHSDSARLSPSADPESRFGARVEAARQIGDPLQKNRAMAKLAGDAAEAGFGDVVKPCVVAINDPLLRNATARECALKLAKAGQEPAAVELARLLSDPMQRNEVFAKLAMGDEAP